MADSNTDAAPKPAPTPLPDRQLVLVTGKGGVGKSLISSALATAAQATGKRTLLAEVTSEVGTRSHLLGQFGAPMAKGEQPVRLASGLDGVRITPSSGHRLFLRAAIRVGMLADAAMRSSALNRFLMAAPAFPEIGTLYHLVWLLRQDAYDAVIIDLPATGHALGLAKLPRTVTSVVPRGLIKEAISEGLDALTDPKRTAGVVVTLPETLPVTEAFELARGLKELDVPVGALVLNRMPDNPFTDDERRALDEHVRARQGELLLGTRELRRLERALDARKVFRENPFEDALMVEVPMVSGSGPEIRSKVRDVLIEGGLAPGKGDAL